MRNRNLRLAALVSAASILLSAAAYASEEESPFAARIGWLHQCLAIKNDALEPGTPVTIIVFGWGHDPIVKGDAPGIRIAGKILGKTDSGEICPALGEWRRGVNEQGGISFYEISLEEGRDFQSTDVGIGIIGLDADPAKPIDLDGNGVADSLTACTSLEGVHFAAWKDEPYAGEPLWTDYYYVGYDVEPDCPFVNPDLSALPPSEWPIDSRLGWVHGCLGIFNTRLQPGTPVTLLMFGAEGERAAGRSILTRRVEGKILGTTESAEDCPALAGRGKEWNELNLGSYYVVALGDGRSLDPAELGIGIVALGPEEADLIDLDGNGAADGFTVCGQDWGYAPLTLQFAIWRGEPYKSALLWRIPSYLFRPAVEVLDCPEVL